MKFQMLAYGLTILVWSLGVAAWDVVSVAANGCVDYGKAARYIGGVSTLGSGADVAVSGNLAFVADGSSGLQVIDFTMPRAPQIVGSLTSLGEVLGIHVVGSYAYVGTHAGLRIVDVSIASSPTEISSYLPGRTSGVFTSGSHTYITGGYGLEVVDVADPVSPIRIGGVQTPGSAINVVVHGDYAYVADGPTAGLTVLSVVNPGSPVIVGNLDTPGDAIEVTVAGSRAYVADSKHVNQPEIQVVDISDPTDPLFVEEVPTEGCAVGVDSHGSHVYVADAEQLQVLSLLGQSTHVLGAVDVPGTVFAVATAGQSVVLTGTRGFHVVEATYPEPISPVAEVGTVDLARGLALQGELLFLADSAGGLMIYDTASSVPVLVGSLGGPGIVTDVDVVGEIACIGLGSAGVGVVNVSNPTQPVLMGSTATGGNVNKLIMDGGYAYVADVNFSVVDVSNAGAPQVVGAMETPGFAAGVAVQGELAFVADSFCGLLVVDVSDPSLPTIVGEIDTPGDACDVVVLGDYAYVSTESPGVQIIDVSVPTSPALLATMDTPCSAERATVRDGLAYIADYDCGVQVYDVSDPQNPELLGGLATGGASVDVAVALDRIYVADTSGGLVVAPAQCVEVSVAVTDVMVARSGDTVTLRWRAGGFQSFEVLRESTGSGELRSRGLARAEDRDWWEYHDELGGAQDAYQYTLRGRTTDGDLMEFGPFAVDGRRSGVALFPVRPFPIRGSAVISFSVPRPMRVRLDVYDAAGRLIRQLASGASGPGQVSLVWDGRNDRGGNVGNGIYFVRLSSEQGAKVRRATVLR